MADIIDEVFIQHSQDIRVMVVDKDSKSGEEEELEKMRHSAAHVMAEAVQSIFPDVRFAIGPAIANGFYYDFDLPRSLTPDDLPIIEAKMVDIIASNVAFIREEVTREKARQLFAAQPYKLELIDEIPDEKVNLYRQGSFVDLCRGPHIKSTKEIPEDALKLDRIAGAYWRGSEKNRMLQRIYGLLFRSKKELDEYLITQEEIKKRDHRKIGKDLDLFVFSDLVGKGLPLFTEKGSIIRRELERFVVDEEISRGYKHVYTPDLANIALYKTSGHYPYYKDSMYPVMKVEEEELMLRPMTCPHHFELYASKPRSYKELPFRIAELAKQFRYEKSGELTGLMRVRVFCLADSHIICQPDQATDEISGVLDLIEYISATLGLDTGDNYRYRLSLGDRKDNTKYYKDDKAWDFAEDVLRKVLIQREANYFEAEKEAAFYGPKIDIQMKNFAGKEDTVFTVQYDFVMPKRFKLTYIDKDQQEKEPIVIHRSSVGAIERTMAFLIEHYVGAFPVWLSPVQVTLIPVADRHLDYAAKLESELRKAGVRAKVDARSERLNLKIRQAQLDKIPYMLVVGDKEVATDTVSVRWRSGEQLPAQSFSSFKETVSMVIANKTKELD
ncbi:MAG: threonine--tRNA ligase [Chloroflexi bacterium]|nr:threonine--tRNA ligase [Chloroflexota bacterium]